MQVKCIYFQLKLNLYFVKEYTNVPTCSKLTAHKRIIKNDVIQQSTKYTFHFRHWTWLSCYSWFPCLSLQILRIMNFYFELVMYSAAYCCLSFTIIYHKIQSMMCNIHVLRNITITCLRTCFYPSLLLKTENVCQSPGCCVGNVILT